MRWACCRRSPVELAARRAGIDCVILPAENRQNVEEDLTPEMTEGVQIHYAKHIEDVLAVALPMLKGRPVMVPQAEDRKVSNAA